MRTRARRVRGVSVAWCVLLACCRTSASGEATPPRAATFELSERALQVDLAQRTAIQVIPPDFPDPQRQEFVQLEMVELRNSGGIPISFEVRHRYAAGEDTLLGTFSPFPPDNPGRFLVATGGRLTAGGVITVTLVPLEEPDPGDQVRAQIRIWLRTE